MSENISDPASSYGSTKLEKPNLDSSLDDAQNALRAPIDQRDAASSFAPIDSDQVDVTLVNSDQVDATLVNATLVDANQANATLVNSAPIEATSTASSDEPAKPVLAPPPYPTQTIYNAAAHSEPPINQPPAAPSEPNENKANFGYSNLSDQRYLPPDHEHSAPPASASQQSDTQPSYYADYSAPNNIYGSPSSPYATKQPPYSSATPPLANNSAGQPVLGYPQGQPYVAYQPVPVQWTKPAHPSATAIFVLSIITLFVPLLCFIPFIWALVVRSETASNPDRYAQGGLLTAGLVISAIASFFTVAFIILVFVIFVVLAPH